MKTKMSSTLLSKFNIIRDLGYKLSPDSTVMDFGCGSGGTVQELRNLGYQSFGCDFEFKQEKNVATEMLEDQKFIRLVDSHPYRLPFDDDTFDFIFSDQVFEHVQNYPESIAEIKRILKPGGFCLHIFPSRYKLIEPHVYVPFSSVINSYPWLYFWASMGIRNEHQEGLTVRDTVNRNYKYLRNNTNYLPKKQIREYFGASFKEVGFHEKLFLKYSAKGRYVYAISRIFPFLPAVYSTLHSRVVLAGQPVKGNQ